MQVDSFLKRSITTGTVSGLAAAGIAALAGRRETASYAAPLNATSHIVWGDQAALRNSASFKYTGIGFLLNHASAVMWAAVHEAVVGKLLSRAFRRRPALQQLSPVISAAAVTAGAYVTDYYLVPKRLTPGFEKRLSGRSMASIYVALAVGMAAGTMLMDRRR